MDAHARASLLEVVTAPNVQCSGTSEGVAAAQGAAASDHYEPEDVTDEGAGDRVAEPESPGDADDTERYSGGDGTQVGDDVTSGRVGSQIRHAAPRAGRDAVRQPDTGTAVRPRRVTDKNSEFTEFMRDARDPLHRMAFLLCGDRHRAEELTQQTFERCYRHWHKARQGDPLVYARRILANLRIDTWRRTRREVLAGPEDLLGEQPAVRGEAPGGSASSGTRNVEDRDAVVRALLQLPVKQRRVVVLRHLLDLSEHEVAAELRIPLGTVKSTASRGLSQLRTILETARGGGAR